VQLGGSLGVPVFLSRLILDGEKGRVGLCQCESGSGASLDACDGVRALSRIMSALSDRMVHREMAASGHDVSDQRRLR
jgi:hypothetical protein